MPVNVLCAVRDLHAVLPLMRELEGGERCAFFVASGGEEALDCALRCSPDILVIEALLPQIDGLGVIDLLRRRLEGRMPRVIGGSMTPFCDAAFLRRGARAVVRLPWRIQELRSALLAQVRVMEETADWNALAPDCDRAAQLLAQMGMSDALRGYTYLSMAAALAARRETRVFSVRDTLYAPVAMRCHTSPANVERLIRHAVESTMNSEKARDVYGFFGNTIDAQRGKPTNAQIIAMLAQRLKIS